MTIKIGEDWELTPDPPYQWIVTHYREGLNKKTMKKVRTPHKTYHPTLLASLRTILEKEVSEQSSALKTADQLLQEIMKAKESILEGLGSVTGLSYSQALMKKPLPETLPDDSQNRSTQTLSSSSEPQKRTSKKKAPEKKATTKRRSRRKAT